MERKNKKKTKQGVAEFELKKLPSFVGMSHM